MNAALRPALYFLWPLVLVTFSAPGRDAPADVSGLDLIALAKAGVRVLSVAIFGWILWQAVPGQRGRVIATLFPWGLLVGWAFVSVLWTALPSVTLGQALGLAGLVLLMACIAAQWRGLLLPTRTPLAISAWPSAVSSAYCDPTSKSATSPRPRAALRTAACSRFGRIDGRMTSRSVLIGLTSATGARLPCVKPPAMRPSMKE